jgi:DNA-binding transcriptional LysR family regulator
MIVIWEGDMELRELRSFCTAARLRSISKAAEELDVGQPTVTTHVQKLEAELGTELFDRIKRPIQLTLAGNTLFDLATPLLEGMDSLVAQTAKGESEGPVRIASTHEMVAHTLLPVVQDFSTRYPHVHVRIRSGFVREVVQMVEEGEVDMGIVPAPQRRDGLDFRGLFPYERVLITPYNHPLLREPLHSLDQIAKWPLILRQPGTHTRMLLEEEFRRRGLSYEIVIELDSMDMIKRYVALGLGVSVGPRLAIDPGDPNGLGVVSLSTLLSVDQAGLLTVRGKALSDPVRRFVSVMEETINSNHQRPG